MINKHDDESRRGQAGTTTTSSKTAIAVYSRVDEADRQRERDGRQAMTQQQKEKHHRSKP